MSLFADRTGRLPPEVRGLVGEFRDHLSKFLGKNLVGAYLFGSIAFPEYEPRAGDLDFYTVTRTQLSPENVSDLDVMHRYLAAKFEFGRKLDGFYIPLTKARRSRSPRGLVYAAHGTIHRGGFDDAWALHREHFHRGSYIRLHGPRPREIFPPADWASIRKDLYRALAYTRSIIRSDPWWAVLNLCRLVYTFKTGNVAVSKLQAAKWALETYESTWRPLIMSAIRTYKQRGSSKDRAVLKRDAKTFLGFASVRVIAFDSVRDTRQPNIEYRRNRRRTAR